MKCTPIALILATTLILACQPTGKQDTFTDTRDGKKYKIVAIDTQTWMAENLNYNAEGSWCYDNEPENCDKYGRLYDWETAIKVCPKGWHLPSDEEWQILVDYVGGHQIAGWKVRAKSRWDEHQGKSRNDIDYYGFSAFPGGYRNHNDGSFDSVRRKGNWWSVTEFNTDDSYARIVNYHYSFMGRGKYNKMYGFSVRCVKFF